jgi:hypothetical protein
MVMVPFKTGDFVTYSGYRTGNEVVAYIVSADNIQVKTPDNTPPYILMEDAIIGVFTANADLEEGQTRVSNREPLFQG